MDYTCDDYVLTVCDSDDSDADRDYNPLQDKGYSSGQYIYFESIHFNKK